MKLLAGMVLFCLCALTGEGKSRRIRRREQALQGLHALIREIGDRQLRTLVSFQEAALRCPPSPQRDGLLGLLSGDELAMPLLTREERASVLAYARSESRSLASLRAERDALLDQLVRARETAHGELTGKGQVFRSVGYLCGAAALLLVL